MSRTCRYFEDLGKLGFYEVDDESKMRLLKTYSHTQTSVAMEPGTLEEKHLKQTQTLQQGKGSHEARRRCGAGRRQVRV